MNEEFYLHLNHLKTIPDCEMTQPQDFTPVKVIQTETEADGDVKEIPCVKLQL